MNTVGTSMTDLRDSFGESRRERSHFHHTYCFFWAWEAKSLAFSLAASAVSRAFTVAVSAKVLVGASPARWSQTAERRTFTTERIKLPHHTWRLTLHSGQDELEAFHGFCNVALKPGKTEFLKMRRRCLSSTETLKCAVLNHQIMFTSLSFTGWPE